jgi:hypothetical protein
VPPAVTASGPRRSNGDPWLHGDLVGVRFHRDLGGLTGMRQADLDSLPADHDRPARRHPPGDHQRVGQAGAAAELSRLSPAGSAAGFFPGASGWLPAFFPGKRRVWLKEELRTLVAVRR